MTSEIRSQVNAIHSADSTARDLTERKSLGKFKLGNLTFESAIDKQAAKDQAARDSWAGHTFESAWGLYAQNSDGERASYDRDTKWFLDKYAPEASELYRVAKGENWFNELDESEFESLKRVAKHEGKVRIFAEDILSELNVTSEGRVRLPIDEERRIQLVHTALGYDNERASVEAELVAIASQIKSVKTEGATTQITSFKSTDTARRVDAILEQRRKKRSNARELFAQSPEPSLEKRDMKMDIELNQIMPSLLEGAQMLSPEAETRLLARLGVMKNKRDESYTIAANTRETEGQHAMWMVLNQRLRNKQFQEIDDRVQNEVLTGRLNELATTEGADLLVLHAFQTDSVKDCGRYFQEEVRRTILRSRVDELVVVDENGSRSNRAEKSERWIKGAVKGLEEAFLFAEDIFKAVGKKAESIFRKSPNPDGFMSRIVGFTSALSNGVGEYFANLADDFPDEIVVPQQRFGLVMPDYFDEFDI